MGEIMARIIVLASAYVTISIIFSIASRKDFWSNKVDNRTIFIAVAAYLALLLFEKIVNATFDRQQFAVTAQAGEYLVFRPGSDVIAGLFLFLIGFCLWMLRMLGAGDAKLLFPVGLFTGLDYLSLFAAGLLALGTIAYIALKLPIPVDRTRNRVCARIGEIRESGRIPYAVILTGALMVALAAKYYAASGY